MIVSGPVAFELNESYFWEMNEKRALSLLNHLHLYASIYSV